MAQSHFFEDSSGRPGRYWMLLLLAPRKRVPFFSCREMLHCANSGLRWEGISLCTRPSFQRRATPSCVLHSPPHQLRGAIGSFHRHATATFTNILPTKLVFGESVRESLYVRRETRLAGGAGRGVAVAPQSRRIIWNIMHSILEATVVCEAHPAPFRFITWLNATSRRTPFS